MAESEVLILNNDSEIEKIATDEDDAQVHRQVVWVVTPEMLA